MRLQRFDQLGLERGDAAGNAEGAVAGVAAGAASDLAEFAGVEGAELVAVELAVGGEGDVVDVEVEAHTDGVGRDQEVDVAVLEELDLRVAGARGERAHNDRRATPLAADQLGDGVDFVGRERDDGRARRQAGKLLLPRIGQHRHARAGDDVEAGEQFLEELPRGQRAQKQRLETAADAQDAVSEDAAAL